MSQISPIGAGYGIITTYNTVVVDGNQSTVVDNQDPEMGDRSGLDRVSSVPPPTTAVDEFDISLCHRCGHVCIQFNDWNDCDCFPNCH